MPSHGESRASLAGRWLFAAILPASALAIGALHTTTLIIVSALAALACGLLWSGKTVRVPRGGRWVLFALALLVGFTMLQLVPLPAAFVKAVAPRNAEIWAMALEPFGEVGPALHPLTVAPSATRVQVLRGFFYLCIFLGALRITGSRGGTTFLERAIVVSCCLAAVVALAHPAVQAKSVFGIYKPRELYAYLEGRYGPLLNANHLAAYLGIGASVALGSALSKTPAAPPVILGSATMLLAGTNVWAGSRGGTASLLFAITLVAGLSLYVRRRFAAGWAGPVLVFVALAFAAVMFGLASSDFARDDLASRDLSKLSLVRQALRLVPLSPWSGFGRGAFETVFPAVRDGDLYVTFTHPENIVAQWSTEWGLPVSVAAAGALFVAMSPRQLLASVSPAVGAWCAIVASLVHDAVDFHFETPGVVVAGLVCVAMVVGGRGRMSSSRRSGDERDDDGGARKAARVDRTRLGAYAVAAGAVVASAAVIPEVGHLLSDDRYAMSGMTLDPGVAAPAFRGALREATLRYPGEAFFPLLGAVRAQRDRQSVVRWIGHALELNPRFGRAHYVLARSLVTASPAQARLEYRLAYTNDIALRETISKEVLGLVDGPAAALELVPEGPIGHELLEQLAAGIQARLPATSYELDRELEARVPESTGVLRRTAEAWLSDAQNDADWCRGEVRCLDRAFASAERLAARAADVCSSHLLLARVRIAKNEVVQGLEGLESAADRVTDGRACSRELVTLSLSVNARARADAAIDRALRRGCAGGIDCVDVYGWAAATEEARGNMRRAVVLYKRAYEADPMRDDILEHIGGLAFQVGLTAEAVDAYGRLAARHPENPVWATRVAELRQTVQAGSLSAPR